MLLDGLARASMGCMATWNKLLRDQFEWHWEHRLRSRLAGLADEEHLREPVAGAWSVRPRGTASTSMAAGAEDLVIDWEHPEPSPAPFTTIAWRFGHTAPGRAEAATSGRAKGAQWPGG